MYSNKLDILLFVFWSRCEMALLHVSCRMANLTGREGSRAGAPVGVASALAPSLHVGPACPLVLLSKS